MLFAQLACFQRSEATQWHVEDVCCLDFAELEALPQGRFGRAYVLGSPDDLDHLIDVIESDQQPFDDVGTCFVLRQAEAAASFDHLQLMIDVVMNQFAEVQRPWHRIDEGDLVDREVLLELCSLE